MFDWNDLRYFLAVARTGSTIAAGKELGVNQSTVQRRLLALEDAIGRRLTERHAGGYRLTPLGDSLRGHAEAVEAAVTGFERSLAASDSDLTGTIRVTCPEADLYRLLTPLLDEFRALYPSLRVDCIVTERFLDLAKGEADVALRGGEPRDNALIGRKLADVPWYVYGTRGYVERHGRPERPEDLAGHAIIAYAGHLGMIGPARWFHSFASETGVVVRSTSVLSAISAARTGIGLAVLPALIGDPEPDLVRVLPLPPELTQPFTILVHPDLRHTPRVRAFFDFIVEGFVRYRPLLEGRTRD